MARWKYFYLIRIEFLGFRYHGWQKQEGLRSINGMIDKTLLFILKHEDFRTLGCGRTDAKVSAMDYAFELFLMEPIIPEQLLKRININLPSDIRAKSIVSVDEKFNIIQHAKRKEYHYYFSFGDKSHPFTAPLVRDFGPKLDLEAMVLAAKVFEGTHQFKRYVSKAAPDTQFTRTIIQSEIVKNTFFSASFLPEDTYVYKVIGMGFMRYQIRLMMGALVDVGRGVLSIEDLQNSLLVTDSPPMRHVAPSSGLVLHKIDFEGLT
ncbi:MAG: tRNA pseudouridine38-40 synthase [Marinoscillum sp.]|jgi:tRNA pseudouridine38-40 synthase